MYKYIYVWSVYILCIFYYKKYIKNYKYFLLKSVTAVNIQNSIYNSNKKIKLLNTPKENFIINILKYLEYINKLQ